MEQAVTLEEISKLPDALRSKGNYVCYCLRSDAAKPRTYFGSSNDLVHRIRQHNGIIKGGASATKTSRPWRIAAVVYGFSDRSAALRYEWFCKMAHSRQRYDEAMESGSNSIQRRAALMARSAEMCASENLKYYYGDSYLQECCAEAFAKWPFVKPAIQKKITEYCVAVK